MTIRDYVSRVGRGIGHLATGVLVLDAVYNASQGNYESAAADAILAAGIEAYTLLGRRSERQLHQLRQQAVKLRQQTVKLGEHIDGILEQLKRNGGIMNIGNMSAGNPSNSLERIIGVPINYSPKTKIPYVYTAILCY